MGKKNKNYDDNYDLEDHQLHDFNCEEDEDENEDKISLEKEEKIIKNLDDDLIKYFGDAKIISPKRKLNNNLKKNKKKDFTIGQKVKINNMHGKILFGPYEKNNKFMCEIELENGNIISEDINKIE